MKGTVNKVIDAARDLAKELHSGQTDKAGKDYFTGHLCSVAMSGNDWKEIVTGYLHDAAEDTQYSEEQVIKMLKERCCDQLNDNDAELIQEAMYLLNSNTASSREEYISRLCQSKNETAKRVKLNDLNHNMDLTRIENPTEKDLQRMERYKKEYGRVVESITKDI